MHVNTLILGGGLTGLSVAYHLEQLGQHDYIVLEKEREPGGLCRSVYQDGFTFDYSGHLLHLHTTYGKKLVRALLKNNLQRLPRRAWIYTGASRVPFPFQAHLYALPEEVRQACVEGLLRVKRVYKTPPAHFEAFCLRAFGKGIYETFMRPYNTKLWGCSPRELTCDWCGPFVPAPTVAQIRRSAVEKTTRQFGYNTSFYYPKKGGAGALVSAIANQVSHLQTGMPVTRIDLKNKKVFAGGKIFSFDRLVNTLPLPLFLRLTAEPSLKKLADSMHCQPISVYQVALKGSCTPFSWIYCPDEKDPFYRVGLQSGFAAANAPRGTYSLYIELPGRVSPSLSRERQIWKALLQKGIIKECDGKITSLWQYIPCAYVVYDKQRRAAVRCAIYKLEKYGCLCAGRYGLWEYSFMEKSLLQGRDIAHRLAG